MVFAVRTPPHETSPGCIISIRGHALAGRTDRHAVFIDCDVIVYCLWMAAFVIEVNESADFSVFEQPVGGQIVHGGVKAHVLYGKARHMFFQFVEGSEEIDRVMAPGAGKAQQERDIRVEPAVMAGQMEKGISIVVFVQAAVPAPGGIRIRKMARDGSNPLWGKGIFLCPGKVAVRAGMGMDGSAVAGNRKVTGGNDAAPDGRDDSGMVKKLLEKVLEFHEAGRSFRRE